MKGYFLTHSIASCNDCDWEDDHWETAQKSAGQHHRQTGHEISLEAGYSKIYERCSPNLNKTKEAQ